MDRWTQGMLDHHVSSAVSSRDLELGTSTPGTPRPLLTPAAALHSYADFHAI